MSLKRAFTIIELLVTISILAITSGYIFLTIANLSEEGGKNKLEIEMRSDISLIVSIISDHIYNADELEIIKSNAKDHNGNNNNFFGLLIKNISNKFNDSLFTLIKPLSKDLTIKELPIYPGDQNYFVGITDINLFVDVEYDNENQMIIYSDPGNSSINYLKLGSTGVLVGGTGNNNQLNTPTGLYLSNNNLFISDTYNNVIFSIEKDKLSNPSLLSRNENLKVIAGVKGIAGFSDGNLGSNTLNKPMGLSVHDGYLYIVDSGNHSIRTMKLEGSELLTYIGTGEPGISEDNSFFKEFKLNSPTDIDYNKENNLLFVSDTNNNRIIAFGPISGNFSYRKPFTLAGIGKNSNFDKSTSPGVFFDKNKNNKTVLVNDKIAGSAGFSGDFSIASGSQFHHPTGIKVLNGSTLIISDSGNNLIRKIYAPDYGQKGVLLLSHGENLVETIIGNVTEIILKKGEKGQQDLKSAIKAPVGGNLDGSAKIAKLNIPTGLTASNDGNLYIADNILGGNQINGYGKLNQYTNGNLKTLSETSFKYIDIDQISINNVDDFISITPIDFMIFKKINDYNSGNKQSLIKISLGLLSYLRIDEPIITNIETSISQREIIVDDFFNY